MKIISKMLLNDGNANPTACHQRCSLPIPLYKNMGAPPPPPPRLPKILSVILLIPYCFLSGCCIPASFYYPSLGSVLVSSCDTPVLLLCVSGKDLPLEERSVDDDSSTASGIFAWFSSLSCANTGVAISRI